MYVFVAGIHLSHQFFDNDQYYCMCPFVCWRLHKLSPKRALSESDRYNVLSVNWWCSMADVAMSIFYPSSLFRSLSYTSIALMNSNTLSYSNDLPCSSMPFPQTRCFPYGAGSLFPCQTTTTHHSPLTIHAPSSCPVSPTNTLSPSLP